MAHNKLYSLLIILSITVNSCVEKDNSPLPIIGNREVVDGDTIYHTIPPFEFMSQDSTLITNASLSEGLYISDFFFMSCPSICPKVKKQMLRIYDKYEGNPKLKFVSHTLDPKRDTPPRLKLYAENLGVDTNQWMFLTGDQDDIMDMADEYFVAAMEDASAPGGFDHSRKILLVDTKGHIRAFADGTDPESVDDFFGDIEKLFSEYEI